MSVLVYFMFPYCVTFSLDSTIKLHNVLCKGDFIKIESQNSFQLWELVNAIGSQIFSILTRLKFLVAFIYDCLNISRTTCREQKKKKLSIIFNIAPGLLLERVNLQFVEVLYLQHFSPRLVDRMMNSSSSSSFFQLHKLYENL